MDAARFLILSVCFVSLAHQAFQCCGEPTWLSVEEGKALLDDVISKRPEMYDVIKVNSAYTNTEASTWYGVNFDNRAPDGGIETCDATWGEGEDARIVCKPKE